MAPRSAALTPREIDEGDRLLTAGRQGELEEVRKLLKNGSEVDYKDLAGFSTLHFAAWKGHADVVAELLRAGAEIDAKNNYPGLTPLHRACQNGHLAVVRALLESGANKDLPDQARAFPPQDLPD
jgi:ankyrin repeat protein